MAQNQSEDSVLKLYLLADELRALANYGLQNTTGPYDRERYEKVLEASARMVSILDNRPFEDIVAEFQDNKEHISPIIGAEAAVFKDNKILLLKRHDNGLWAVPGGLVDVGETLTNAALRELKEESGLTGSIVRLLGIFDSRPWKSRSKFQVYHVIFEVSVEKGVPSVTIESTDCGYFAKDELPDLSPGHDMRVPFLFQLVSGQIKVPYFDTPDHIKEI